MIVNRHELVLKSPIKDMSFTKNKAHGVSWGLSEAGYDIRIRQSVTFDRWNPRSNAMHVKTQQGEDDVEIRRGRFVLASSMEEFVMPQDLVGVVHDKSTWARQGLSVFNTVIEPGWSGGLTLELVYHGQSRLHVPAGAGIAQVLFSRVQVPAAYAGKYQDQSTDPVPAILEV
jgi:dCTP deaminase